MCLPRALWNNMLSPEGQKATSWSRSPPFLCPSPESPYLATRFIMKNQLSTSQLVLERPTSWIYDRHGWGTCRGRHPDHHLSAGLPSVIAMHWVRLHLIAIVGCVFVGCAIIVWSVSVGLFIVGSAVIGSVFVGSFVVCVTHWLRFFELITGIGGTGTLKGPLGPKKPFFKN